MITDDENYLSYINQNHNLSSKEKEVLFNIHNKKYSYTSEFENYDNSQLFNEKNSKIL